MSALATQHCEAKLRISEPGFHVGFPIIQAFTLIICLTSGSPFDFALQNVGVALQIGADCLLSLVVDASECSPLSAFATLADFPLKAFEHHILRVSSYRS